ncbi:MAG: GDP-mannose 4,6-dehydratase [Actinomycetota bacterium]|nr:GDP-mannose 4,6-dehydratase [Actinomycetota bacterium]
MRVLITGASGLAGGYLARACVAAGDEVVGLSRHGSAAKGAGAGRSVDLRDAAAVRDAVGDIEPAVVYHLAALSSVGRSWEEPAETLQTNVLSSVHLLEALRLEAPGALVVWVSSCEVYGNPARLPISEDAPVQPASPYAVSKAAGEQLANVYAQAYGLHVITARPFNHTGPGQRQVFILSSLARQAAEARLRGAQSLRVVTGNPHTRRDFTDVRDVVRAYRLLAQLAEPGVYNVSSGRSVSAADQVALLAEVIAPIEVEHVVDPARLRAHEVMELAGAPERIRAATGWQPEIPFRETMRQTIEWWEQRLRET